MTRLDEYAARQRLAKHRRSKGRKGKMSDAVRAEKIDGYPCRVCGPLPAGVRAFASVEAHHLIPRAKFIGCGVDAPVHHADNLVPLCGFHHQQHHTTTNRVPRSVLTDAEIRFVIEHTSEGWAELWYPTTEGNT